MAKKFELKESNKMPLTDQITEIATISELLSNIK